MESGALSSRVLSATALSVAALACLVGCSQESSGSDASPSVSASSASSRESLHPGTFHADLPGGATVTLTVPAPRVPDDSLERLRQAARVPRATYATVDINNRHGQSPVSVSRIVLTARDGATYQLEHPARALKRWCPRPSGDTHRAKDGTSLDAPTAQALVRRLDDAASRAVGDIAVGEKGRNILIGDISAVPRDFASLEIVPLIGDRELAPVRVHPREAEGSSSDSGSPDASERDGSGGSDAGATSAPGQEVPPDNPLPGGDPRPSTSPAPTSPARPEDPVAPEPGVPEPVVPNPVVPQPVVPNPVVPDPVVPSPVVPDPVVPTPVVPQPSSPGEVVPDPVVTDPVVPDPVVPDPVVPDPSVPREADPAPANPEMVVRGPAMSAPAVVRPAAQSDDESAASPARSNSVSPSTDRSAAVGSAPVAVVEPFRTVPAPAVLPSPATTAGAGPSETPQATP